MSRHAIFLEKQFIQDGGVGKLIRLEEKVSKEQRAKDPIEPNQIEPVQTLIPPPRRSDRISHPLKGT